MRIFAAVVLFLASVVAHANELHPALLTLHEIRPAVVASEAAEFTGTEGLIPLGFSPTGEFSYFLAVRDDACGSCPNFFIVNLTTDRVVDRRVWEGVTVGEVVSEYGSQLTEILREHDITPIEDKTIHRFPLTLGGEAFSASIKHESTGGVDSKYPHAGSEIWFHSSEKGSKRIGHVPADAIGVTAVEQVDGYLLSPHEDRAVVIASGTVSGYEFEYRAQFFLFGSHLRAGFKKPNEVAP